MRDEQNVDLKIRVLRIISGCEISLYMSLYGPPEAVVPISNIMHLMSDKDGVCPFSRYKVRKALKELISDGLVIYTHQGQPAEFSAGYESYPELMAESGPPINGYALTAKGKDSQTFKDAVASWEESMKAWCEEPLC